MSVEKKLAELGLELPAPLKVPEGLRLPYTAVRIHNNIAYISGNLPLTSHGTLLQPLGKVGRDVSLAQASLAARAAGLSIFSSLKRAIDNLDRIESWISLFGIVNGTDSFDQHPKVINGCSDLLIEVLGFERGAHSRTAMGGGSLPFNVPVEIEATVALRN
jgi:enamine deaminase RidA (YjgF/YER057c/UK114 family)